MINITNITRQILLASVAVMAATGEASAHAPIAVITQTGLPYFASPQAVNSKPLGQFAFNTHVCITGKVYTWNRLQFLQYVLPSGELVYTLARKGIIARDPAGNKSCRSKVASTTLPASIPPPVQPAPQPAPNYVAPPTIPASGNAPAQTSYPVIVRSKAFAVIAKGPIPYYAGANLALAAITPPQGHFAVGQHICANWEVTVHGRDIINIDLPSDLQVDRPDGGKADAIYSREAFIPDPAGDKKCQSIAAQAPTQAKGMNQRTGDAVTAKSSPGTSAQSASPEQPPSEANQAKANVRGTGTDAGSLEAGLAAEKRGDWKAAFLLLEPLAKQGNADAQTQIGFMYETGRGVWHGRVVNGVTFPDEFNYQDGTVALVWYRKAADQGNAQAEVGLGRVLKHALGPNPAAYAAAMTWFRKAADQGNAEGQFQLGYMYYEGKGGIPQDFAEAMKWFRKAADQGYGQAQGALGFMYERAQGVPQDYAEARKWYRKAADQGNTNAQKYSARLSEEEAAEAEAKEAKEEAAKEEAKEAKEEEAKEAAEEERHAAYQKAANPFDITYAFRNQLMKDKSDGLSTLRQLGMLSQEEYRRKYYSSRRVLESMTVKVNSNKEQADGSWMAIVTYSLDGQSFTYKVGYLKGSDGLVITCYPDGDGAHNCR